MVDVADSFFERVNIIPGVYSVDSFKFIIFICYSLKIELLYFLFLGNHYLSEFRPDH